MADIMWLWRVLGSDIMLKERSRKDCPICNRPQSRSDKYDAYYCKHCNIWLEPVCGNRNCEFCAARPRNPITPRNLYRELMSGIQDMTDVREGVIQVKSKKIRRPRKTRKNPA